MINMGMKPSGFGHVFKIVAFVMIAITIIVGFGVVVWVYVLNQKAPNLSAFFPTEEQIVLAKYPKSAICDIKLKNSITSSAIVSAQIDIYETGNYAGVVDSVTTDGTTGIGTTGDKFTSGDTYTVHINKTASHLDLWDTWTVPNAVSETDTKLYSVIKGFTLGTFTLSVLDADGNAYVTTGDWNKTAGGASHPGRAVEGFEVTVRNTVDNTGFIGSTSPVYNVDYKVVLEVKVDGTGYEGVGLTAPVGKTSWAGVTRYWFIDVPAASLTRTKVGNVITGGSAVEAFTLDLSNYAADTADITFSLHIYSSSAYRYDNGGYGSFAYDPSVSVQLDLVH